IPEGIGVIVVDNASHDATVDAVARSRPGATVVVNEENLGFASGVNRGMSRAPDNHDVVLLNPDARLRPGAVERLMAFLDDRPRAGAVSALIVDEGGVPERYSCGREPSLSSVAVHYLGLSSPLRRWSVYSPPRGSAAQRRDWVAGTAVLLRRRTIDEVGRLDESYFLYAEDHDWCRRARDAGW